MLPPAVHLLDVPIHPVRREQLLQTIVAWGDEPGLKRVYNVNVHGMNMAERHADFRQALQGADLIFCDGQGVRLGARMAGVEIPERLAMSDWMDEFSARAGAAGQSVFALGDEPGVAADYQAEMKRRNPAYVPAGSHHGFFDKTGAQNDRVIDEINASGARHLLVGFGMPLQERWIEANAHRLKVSVAYPCGATFRWFTGRERRAPKWMADNGLEWLSRLARHPVKLFGRYVVGNPRFIARVLSDEIFMSGRRGAIHDGVR